MKVIEIFSGDYYLWLKTGSAIIDRLANSIVNIIVGTQYFSFQIQGNISFK